MFYVLFSPIVSLNKFMYFNGVIWYFCHFILFLQQYLNELLTNYSECIASAVLNCSNFFYISYINLLYHKTKECSENQPLLLSDKFMKSFHLWSIDNYWICQISLFKFWKKTAFFISLLKVKYCQSWTNWFSLTWESLKTDHHIEIKCNFKSEL